MYTQASSATSVASHSNRSISRSWASRIKTARPLPQCVIIFSVPVPAKTGSNSRCFILSFQINGRYVAYAHTIFAYSAFLTALACGLGLHYTKIVENQYYTYPDEWFPSVSATIGDRYPERSFFQVFIAITSGARFTLVFLWYLLVARPTTVKSSKFLAGVGLFRTITCGGWTYVTSTDDHDWHDIFMISYLVATIPWTVGCITLGPRNPRSLKWRKIFAGCFFGTILPLVYFFIQHKVHRVAGGEFCSPFSFFSFPPLLFLPSFFLVFVLFFLLLLLVFFVLIPRVFSAYTIYAFFEWSLVLFDVAFDAVTAIDFAGFEIVVKDIQGVTKGYVMQILPK